MSASKVPDAAPLESASKGSALRRTASSAVAMAAMAGSDEARRERNLVPGTAEQRQKAHSRENQEARATPPTLWARERSSHLICELG